MAQSTRRAQSHTRKASTRRPRLSKVSNARDALADFSRGTETYCLTFGQFSLFDAVEAVLDKTGPADVVVSTWTAASADLSRSAEFLRDQRIRAMRWLIDGSFLTRKPDYASTIVDLFGAGAIRTLGTHAKFVLITNETWHVVIRTSMNLNENRRLENIEVTDDPDFAAFMLGIVDELFAELPAADLRSQALPTLDGVDQILPVAQLAMGHGVKMGAR
ncbi:hypothetical protein [Rhizomonospora bruguierae]|uniref:hypothetical protein n=1 Tax=Rhizomonospora bruguierae TaxID=1581705 RepID=UPI001BCFE30A|nr:hypothetical protein [Micromonospora sp. NBRC 107566]